MLIKKLLLADDDADDAQLFEEALNEVSDNVNFSHVENGYELIRFLDKNCCPDIIFLDLNMPQMNGWQALSTLKNNEDFKKIPVVIYTTSSHAEEKQIALDLGADGLMIKPSNFNTLKKLLKNIFSNTTQDLSALMKEVSKKQDIGNSNLDFQ